jgi:hypothetical protein
MLVSEQLPLEKHASDEDAVRVLRDLAQQIDRLLAVIDNAAFRRATSLIGPTERANTSLLKIRD